MSIMFGHEFISYKVSITWAALLSTKAVYIPMSHELPQFLVLAGMQHNLLFAECLATCDGILTYNSPLRPWKSIQIQSAPEGESAWASVERNLFSSGKLGIRNLFSSGKKCPEKEWQTFYLNLIGFVFDLIIFLNPLIWNPVLDQDKHWKRCDA